MHGLYYMPSFPMNLSVFFMMMTHESKMHIEFRQQRYVLFSALAW
jgi:hypothetical protein